MQIDHLGIATDDADGMISTFGELLEAPIAHEEDLDGLRVVFLDLGNGYFELLEPFDDEGPVSRFLDRSGPGIHHVAVRTDDIDTALENAADRGIELIDEEPRVGAWGHDIAFIHPESTGGVLVEFVQH